MFIPAILYVFDIEFKPLAGAENKPEEVVLSYDSWFDGSWQEFENRNMEFANPVRPILIRSKNEFIFRTSGKSTNYVMIGKNNQLFAYNYFSAYRGFDLKTEDWWDAKGLEYAKIRDTLAANGVQLLVVIAPNKVRYMPEFLPDDVKKTPGENTNYDRFLKTLSAHSISVLDLNAYFLEMKDTISTPPFPNTGTHWNNLGVLRALPRFDLTISSLLKVPSQDFVQVGGYWSDSLILGSDSDLGDGLNLLSNWTMENQFYPELKSSNPSDRKPNILFVSDSFFWQMKHGGVADSLSNDWTFWFYNNTEYCNRNCENKREHDKSWDRIKQVDLVVIQGTEGNMTLMPYELTKDLFK